MRLPASLHPTHACRVVHVNTARLVSVHGTCLWLSLIFHPTVSSLSQPFADTRIHVHTLSRTLSIVPFTCLAPLLRCTTLRESCTSHQYGHHACCLSHRRQRAQQQSHVRPNHLSQSAQRNPCRAAVRKCVATPCIATPHLIVRSYPRTLHLNLSLAGSVVLSSPHAHFAPLVYSPRFPLLVRRTRPNPPLTPPLLLSSLSLLLRPITPQPPPTDGPARRGQFGAAPDHRPRRQRPRGYAQDHRTPQHRYGSASL